MDLRPLSFRTSFFNISFARVVTQFRDELINNSTKAVTTRLACVLKIQEFTCPAEGVPANMVSAHAIAATFAKIVGLLNISQNRKINAVHDEFASMPLTHKGTAPQMREVFSRLSNARRAS